MRPSNRLQLAIEVSQSSPPRVVPHASCQPVGQFFRRVIDLRGLGAVINMKNTLAAANAPSARHRSGHVLFGVR